MAELWGDDDYLYGDYLKWKRQMPLWPFVLTILSLVGIGLFLWKIWE